MKRILITVILVLLAFSILFCACGTQDLPTVQEGDAGNGLKIPSQSNGIPWNEAKNHFGETNTVYGPVVSARWVTTTKGQPTFLNIGKPYPDPGRFQVIIWVENRDNFPFRPEEYYLGKTIYVTGYIVNYEGVPEIEVMSPNQIKI